MSKATLIVPGQEVFRSLYDQTIPKLQNYDSINTKWHAQVGDAVFESVCLALADTISGERRMHTSPRPLVRAKHPLQSHRSSPRRNGLS
jgi:hypothetical protein